MKNNIEKYRVEYKSIKSIFCPYLGREVLLTSAGFKHLIWKSEMGMRPVNEINLRLNSIKFIKEILEKSGTLQEMEKSDEKTFYAFIAIVENKKYKVVVSNTKDGRIIFNSIIPKWITSRRDRELHKTKNPS